MPCHALLLGSSVCQETLHCIRATAERVTPADRKLETSLFKMVFLKTRHEIVERGRPAYYKGPETEIAFSNKINPGINSKHAVFCGALVGLL